MSKIQIVWLSDYADCETCGGGGAEGAIVYVDGEIVLSMVPVAHCFGGDSWSKSEVIAALMAHLGHKFSDDYGELPIHPAESSAGSPSEASASAPATDALIHPGFVVAPREVVEPFYSWAKDNVAAEEDGGYIWSGLGCQNERIRVWFGPSEFGRLAEVFAALPPPGGGKGEGKQEDSLSVAESAAAGPSACAATAPHQKSEGEG